MYNVFMYMCPMYNIYITITARYIHIQKLVKSTVVRCRLDKCSGRSVGRSAGCWVNRSFR